MSYNEFYTESIKKRLNEYTSYTDLTNEDLNEEYSYIIDCWERFISDNSPGLQVNKDYFIHEKDLFEVIRRLDKRRVYYKVFHDLLEINEFKQVAIQCYWINTLKPFMVVNEKSPIYNSPNELFAIYLIISVIRGVYQDLFPDKEFTYPSSKRIADIAYNFKYCDLSREATITFVETFADNYGIGIQYILDNC